MRLKRAHPGNPEINMTPVIDCVFQLMIFFLIATQVKKNEVTDLTLPVSRQAEEVKAGKTPPLIVNILRPDVSRGKAFVCMGNPFDLPTFKAFMKQRQAFYKNQKQEMPIVRIRADKDSHFQQIQDCLIACRDVEIWQVRLSTIKVQY